MREKERNWEEEKRNYEISIFKMEKKIQFLTEKNSKIS